MTERVSANVVQRTMQRIASLRPVAFVFRHTFHHIDRAAVGVLRGRTVSGIVAGVPNIMLTSTGARTGRPRTVPLVGIDVADGVAIVGTRFGSPHHPGWYHNLVADPRAVMARRDEVVDVVARPVVPGAEYDAIMTAADRVYSGFPVHRRRISARTVPVFVLQPAAAWPTPARAWVSAAAVRRRRHRPPGDQRRRRRPPHGWR